MKKIFLSFEPKCSALSGNDFGFEVFCKQVKQDYILNNKLICVVIPDYVVMVGMSFVEGFIREISEEFGKNGVRQHLIIESSSERVKSKFYKAMEL